jgi:hypothetical protein
MRQPICMYRNLTQWNEGPEFERHYRIATAEIVRSLKPKPGPYRHITTWWPMHKKPMPKRVDQ